MNHGWNGWMYYIFFWFYSWNLNFIQALRALIKFGSFIPLNLSRHNNECLKLPEQSYLPCKISTQLCTVGLFLKVSKVVLLVYWSLFNVSGKLIPTCLALDAQTSLVQYPVNMLVSIPESLRNSLRQRETCLQTPDSVVLNNLWETVLFFNNLKDL